MNRRFDKVDDRFGELRASIDARFDDVRAQFDKMRTGILDLKSVIRANAKRRKR